MYEITTDTNIYSVDDSVADSEKGKEDNLQKRKEEN